MREKRARGARRDARGEMAMSAWVGSISRASLRSDVAKPQAANTNAEERGTLPWQGVSRARQIPLRGASRARLAPAVELVDLSAILIHRDPPGGAVAAAIDPGGGVGLAHVGGLCA